MKSTFVMCAGQQVEHILNLHRVWIKLELAASVV